MSLMDLMGLTTRGTGECIIKIGGSEISEFYPNLQTSVINLNVLGSSEATLNFVTLRDDQGSWPIMEDSRFYPWKKIEIIVVFSDQQTPLFSGYIREINNDLSEQGQTSTTTLVCQDDFLAMDRQVVQKNWDEQRESLDIIQEIIRPYGITLATGVSVTPVNNLQQNKTDYRFIREVADNNRFEMYLRTKTGGAIELYLGPAQTSASPSNKAILVRAGRQTNCFGFNVKFDGYLPDSITTATLARTSPEIDQSDNTPQQPLLGNQTADSSASGLRDFQWSQPPGHGNNQEAAEAQAQAEAERQALKLKATGRIDGTVYGALLMPGTLVSVAGAGTNNGDWYVKSTSHEFSSGGYVVNFELMRNASAGDEKQVSHVLSGAL
ncbi:MAG TPA: hypothetical protein ENJ41_03250 [Oceanospirillales bacterium]|nr:hypothetical protein [Oceanospirillales bacterium]